MVKGSSVKDTEKSARQDAKLEGKVRKLSEYGKQLVEKQKVKHMYGMREKQFKRFFAMATQQEGVPGEVLLSLLERRLDNVVFRLKMATSRAQARQIIVHGHIRVNQSKVLSPSYIVDVGDEVSLSLNIFDKKVFLEQVISKRLNLGVKVPDWLQLNKKDYKGMVLRVPVRADISVPIEEHFIVELYSR
jgi:small subunit ribosomal protein S4